MVKKIKGSYSLLCFLHLFSCVVNVTEVRIIGKFLYKIGNVDIKGGFDNAKYFAIFKGLSNPI